MNLKSFKQNDWVKIYEGRWSFLTSSHFGDQYTKELHFGPRPFMPQAVILISNHRSSGWVRQSDRDILGNYLSSRVQKNPALIKQISNKLKTQAKDFLKFISEHENTVATKKLYEEFWKKLLNYYNPHINVKYVADYLSPELLKKSLPLLQSARLAAEPVLNRTEDFMVSFGKRLDKETKYNADLLLCLTKKEVLNYFKTKKLPRQSELKKRIKKSAYVFNEKTSEFYTGKQAYAVEKLLHTTEKTKELKGFTAFGGKVKGRVKIVMDPKKAAGFNKGDILVTGATRPEFLPIMHKAAAFVTDAGGILSHAAITAREMKKPCVIGTQIATKVLKDGDLVEIDADNGVVKKL